MEDGATAGAELEDAGAAGAAGVEAPWLLWTDIG